VQKPAEPIEMLLGMLSQVDLRNHILDGYRSPWKGAILRGRACPRHAHDILT